MPRVAGDCGSIWPMAYHNSAVNGNEFDFTILKWYVSIGDKPTTSAHHDGITWLFMSDDLFSIKHTQHNKKSCCLLPFSTVLPNTHLTSKPAASTSFESSGFMFSSAAWYEQDTVFKKRTPHIRMSHGHVFKRTFGICTRTTRISFTHHIFNCEFHDVDANPSK